MSLGRIKNENVSVSDNTNVYQQGYAVPTAQQNDSFEDLLRKVKLEIESSQKHIK